MTEETWTLSAGDRTFVVPRLPLRVTRAVYPVCQRLTNSGLPLRLTKQDVQLEITETEAEELSTIMFLACQAAAPDLTKEQFDEMPISPSQLYDAFFAIRYACGGWTLKPVVEEPGETMVMEKSPT